MVALKDQWKEERRQRQIELEQRQQEVRQVLDTFQNDRLAMSAQLRQELSAFQQALQQDTQSFLAEAYQQRLANAKAVAEVLQAYKSNLQEQVAQFLSVTAAERSLMAQELFQTLDTFRNNLSMMVADLRLALQQRMQEIQLEVQVLQADTQDMLGAFREQRIQEQQQLWAELSAYVDGLREDVQIYLSALEQLREDRASQVWAMLHQSRTDRAAEMEVLMAEFAQFRTYLQEYRSSLSELVWGNGESFKDVQLPTPPVPSRPVAAKPVQRPAPVRAAFPPRPKPPTLTVTRPTPATPLAAAPPASPTPVITPPAEPPKVEPVATQQPALEPANGVEVAAPPENIQDLSDAIEVPEIQPESMIEAQDLARDPAQLEMDIFKYIQDLNGARLTEIESALSINRFQAVDALRSLIKKGNVTQRDRIYLIPEEVSL